MGTGSDGGEFSGSEGLEVMHHPLFSAQVKYKYNEDDDFTMLPHCAICIV